MTLWRSKKQKSGRGSSSASPDDLRVSPSASPSKTLFHRSSSKHLLPSLHRHHHRQQQQHQQERRLPSSLEDSGSTRAVSSLSTLRPVGSDETSSSSSNGPRVVRNLARSFSLTRRFTRSKSSTFSSVASSSSTTTLPQGGRGSGPLSRSSSNNDSTAAFGAARLVVAEPPPEDLRGHALIQHKVRGMSIVPPDTLPGLTIPKITAHGDDHHAARGDLYDLEESGDEDNDDDDDDGDDGRRHFGHERLSGASHEDGHHATAQPPLNATKPATCCDSSTADNKAPLPTPALSLSNTIGNSSGYFSFLGFGRGGSRSEGDSANVEANVDDDPSMEFGTYQGLMSCSGRTAEDADKAAVSNTATSTLTKKPRGRGPLFLDRTQTMASLSSSKTKVAAGDVPTLSRKSTDLAASVKSPAPSVTKESAGYFPTPRSSVSKDRPEPVGKTPPRSPSPSRENGNSGRQNLFQKIGDGLKQHHHRVHSMNQGTKHGRTWSSSSTPGDGEAAHGGGASKRPAVLAHHHSLLGGHFHHEKASHTAAPEPASSPAASTPALAKSPSGTGDLEYEDYEEEDETSTSEIEDEEMSTEYDDDNEGVGLGIAAKSGAAASSPRFRSAGEPLKHQHLRHRAHTTGTLGGSEDEEDEEEGSGGGGAARRCAVRRARIKDGGREFVRKVVMEPGEKLGNVLASGSRPLTQLHSHLHQAASGTFSLAPGHLHGHGSGISVTSAPAATRSVPLAAQQDRGVEVATIGHSDVFLIKDEDLVPRPASRARDSEDEDLDAGLPGAVPADDLLDSDELVLSNVDSGVTTIREHDDDSDGGKRKAPPSLHTISPVASAGTFATLKNGGSSPLLVAALTNNYEHQKQQHAAAVAAATATGAGPPHYSLVHGAGADPAAPTSPRQSGGGGGGLLRSWLSTLSFSYAPAAPVVDSVRPPASGELDRDAELYRPQPSVAHAEQRMSMPLVIDSELDSRFGF